MTAASLYPSAMAAQTTKCCDKYCMLITLTKHDVHISKKSVTHIETEVPCTIASGYVFVITPHAYEKNWCIATNFLFPNNLRTHNIPILTSKSKVVLKVGQVICHVQIMKIKNVMELIQGNIYHKICLFTFKTINKNMKLFEQLIKVLYPPPPSSIFCIRVSVLM